jgi:hypothetical protein
MMRKSPGFTAVALLTLGLGIGANTAIFSVVHALLLQPLPLRDPSRLLSVSASNPKRGVAGGAFSVACYETLRDRNRSYEGIAAFVGESVTMTGGAGPQQLSGARVSPNFFDVLRAAPALGRAFEPAEGEPGGRPVVVLSHHLWEQRFASNPAALGQP